MSSQRAALDAPYRGQDRRSLIGAHHDVTGRPFFIAGFGLVLLTAVVFVLGSSDSAAGDLKSIAAGFELSAGALGVVAATLCVVRWRLAGDARALWLGTAVGIYAAISIALAQLLPVILPGQPSLGWVRTTGLLVSLTLFAYVLRSPEVDARVTPLRTFGIAIGAFLVLGVILTVSPLGAWLAGIVTAEQDAVASIIALAWAGYATTYVLRGIRDRRLLFAWYGLTMFGLTLAELARALQSSGVDLVVGSAIIRSIALLYAVMGVTRELQTLFASQSGRLLKTTVDTLSTSASLQAAHEREEELAHEARNALTAIEGATQTLERFRENLDDDTRQSLALAVSDEIGRLQRLVGASTGTDHPVSFRLSDIIGPQLDLVRAQGAQAVAAVPADLLAYGRPADFAEVLQNLLVNARIHGRGTITVRAADNGDYLLVRVEDRGAGVPVPLRKAIFERGRRASDSPGSGLGLYLSRQLIQRQRGNLWVEDAPGGGASFVMAIPTGAQTLSASFTDSGRLQPVEHRDNGVEPANGHSPVAGRRAQRTKLGAGARRRQHQEPVD